ncbi:MAG: hypothetical protein A3A16_02705 [Candidatus Harrisonbacteria bacterium RIFCSPLOWO2_01_FULL_44_18]|uniref:Membrane protein 6-pyruvoyl-tetrahydropterin synthase-related domain-containing protein n=1 Tax=Candidatus Harrisonbacteria bacterium RIFCSPLOWO2_01_FULL_44_18 TaxID=1798407 RepID=A0A1G1ZL12_9BACT|nr:MAG: hypothetical protein A3A16_02705 [Candidatus Harrisonbacteria bacterium RIFCSPLOWO2_01_FULL_44_18]
MKILFEKIVRHKESWWMDILLLSLPIFIALAPELLGFRVLYRMDLLTAAEPTFSFYQNAIRAGESFLLNPISFGGFPTILNTIGGLFYPINYLFFRFLEVLTAYHWLTFLHLVLGAFFTARLLKEFKVSWAGRLIGGITYIASAWFYVGESTLTNGVPYLPLLFLIFYKIWAEKRWRWVFLGGLSVGFLWLSTNYNWVQEIFLGLAIFSLYLLWRSWREKVPMIQIAKVVGKWFAVMAVGLAIGLAQILPVLVFIPQSSRIGGVSFETALVGAANPQDFVRFLLPFFHPPHIPDAQISFYLGALSLFLLLYAFTVRRGLARFLSFFYLFILLLVVNYSPLIWIFTKLPIMNMLRGAGRWMFLAGFVSSLLVGFGMDQFLEKNFSRSKNAICKLFLWLSGIVATGILMLSAITALFGEKILAWLHRYFDLYMYPARPYLQPMQFYHDLIDRYYQRLTGLFDITSPSVFLPVFFLVATSALIFYYRRNKLAEPRFIRLSFILVALNFIAVFPFYRQTYSRSLADYAPSTVQFLQNYPGLSLSVLPGDSQAEFYRKFQDDIDGRILFLYETLQPNINQRFGINSLGYYDNLMNRRMARAAAHLGNGKSVIKVPVIHDPKALLKDKIAVVQSNKWLMDLLGVKYLISVFPLDETRFEKVFSGQIPPYNIPIGIYENKEARPFVYFAGQVTFISEDEERAFKMLKETSADPLRVLIECAACPNFARANKQEAGEVILLKQDNADIVIKTFSANDEFLIVARNNIPGWKVFIDGKEAPLYTSNSVYMGIFVPSGAHTVNLRYSYKNLIEGLLKR